MIYNLENRQLLTDSDLSVSITRLKYVPNSELLAAGLDDGRVLILSGDPLEFSTLFRHNDIVTHLDFSAAGQYGLSASFDSPLRVWETAAGRGLASLTTGASPSGATFNPANNTVVYSAVGLRSWTWDADTMIAAACARLQRNFTEVEWRTYFGEHADYQQTCPGLP